MTSFNKFRFQIVLLSIIINVIKSDECSKGQTYYENKCLNCYDPHCEKCRFSSIGSCVSCEKIMKFMEEYVMKSVNQKKIVKFVMMNQIVYYVIKCVKLIKKEIVLVL